MKMSTIATIRKIPPSAAHLAHSLPRDRLSPDGSAPKASITPIKRNTNATMIIAIAIAS